MFEAPLKLEISATAVAWYAAIVATLSFLVSAANYFRDRPKIKIQFKRGYKTTVSALGYDEASTYSMITVINLGRRPIQIERAAFKTYAPGAFILSDSFADHRKKVLTEENPQTMFLVDETSYALPDVSHVLVYDGQGREYRKYLTQIPTFRKIAYLMKRAMNKPLKKG